jgi:hypothetical protein
MSNDQNRNDSNQADKGPTRGDSQWRGMQNITKLYSQGEGSPAVGWLIGAFIEKGKDLICQPWNKHGALYMLVYMWDDTVKGMQPLKPVSTDMHEGSSAVAWLVGDFDGNLKDEVCQVWGDDDGAHMIVYALPGQEMVEVGSTPPDTGLGYQAGAWLVGNICHPRVAKQNICQVWKKDYDALGLTIWEWTPEANNSSQMQMQAIWTSHDPGHDLGEGYEAVAWLIGDINGDGLDEIIQVWDDHRVAMIVYGWVADADGPGQGGMKVLWSGDIPTAEGVGAVAWLIGDVDGDGKAEIIQIYDDDELAASIVYAWRDGSGMVEISKKSYPESVSPDALSWQVGDFNGDGKIEICHIYDTNGDIGMTVYGWDGYNLRWMWYNYDMGVTSNSIRILVGNVTAGSGDNICQLIDGDDGLDIVVYGGKFI